MFNHEELNLRSAFFSKAPRQGLLGYASAFLATMLAAALTALMWPFIDPAVSLLFFIAVLFSSWYGGIQPGLLSSLLSTIGCNYFFVKPAGSFALGPEDLLRLTLFMLAAVFVSSLTMTRKQALDAALRMKSQLAVTFKSIGDAVITTDARGKVTFMNYVAQSLTGWKEEEARGRALNEIFQLTDASTNTVVVDTVVERVIRDNAVIGLGSASVVMVTRDGSQVPVDEIATPLRDADGNIAGVVLVLRNVTEHRVERGEEKILSEKIALLDSVDASMYAMDPQGRCLFISKSASLMLGFRSEDLLGRDIHEALHPLDTCQTDECPLRSMINKEGPSLIRNTFHRRNQTSVPVELSTVPILIGEAVLGAVVTITDLTNQNRAQEALLRLTSIVDSVDQAVITHTVDGIITSWNRSAENIYGYSAEEVSGRSISIIHPPGKPRELTELFTRVANQEPVETFETIRIGKGGERVHVQISVAPLIDPNGNVSGISQIARDITALKAKEEAEVIRNNNRASESAPARVQRASSGGFSDRVVEAGRNGQAAQLARATDWVRSSVVMIGRSSAMQKLFSTVERIAPTDSSVLITGATGTGKELIARAIHDQSLRRCGPFVDINCSAIPETLIEAELFGHQKGTFTGANENRAGLFEMASGGTLFLDEVDALPLAAQAKLLRVLQEKCVRRIGGRTNIAVDVRIISATNSDLPNAIGENRFRADLFYRLRVVPLQVPELCKRDGDLQLLIDHFLKRHAQNNGGIPRNFTPEALRVLLEYPWPGNVRELENAVEYALAMNADGDLGLEDLPPELISVRDQQNSTDLKPVLEAFMSDSIPLAEIEKRYILSVLQQFGGNQVKAAAALGIDRSKLYRRLRQYGVKAVKFLQEEELDGLQLRSGRKEEG